MATASARCCSLFHHTRLYSFRFNCRIVSLTAANTKRMFSVSETTIIRSFQKALFSRFLSSTYAEHVGLAADTCHSQHDINMHCSMFAIIVFKYITHCSKHFQLARNKLRPPAGRQYGVPISQQPLNRSLPNFQQLLLMSNEGKVESFSSFAYG